MANVIEEFVATLGWEVDDTEMKEFDDAVSDMGSTLKWVTGILTGAATAMAAFVTVTNSATSIQTNLARSFGISAAAAENWGYLLGTVGLETTQVIDMMRDLNLNIGRIQSKARGFQIVEDAVNRLHLKTKDLTKLSREMQFEAVLEAAQKMAKAEGPAQAIALTQKILGTESAKVVGWLGMQNDEVSELIRQQAKVNVLNDEARQMAVEYTALWDNFGAVIDSAKKTLAAYLGEAISPIFEETIKWVSANKELLRSNIRKWAKDIISVFKWFIGTAKDAWTIVKQVTDVFGGLKNSLKLAAIAFTAFKIAKFVTAIKAALVVAKLSAALKLLISPTAKITALFTVFGLVMEDFAVWMRGGESVVGKLGDKFGAFMMDDFQPFVAGLFGISKEEFNFKVAKALEVLVNLFGTDIPAAIEVTIGAIVDLFNIGDDSSKTSAEKHWAFLVGIKDLYINTYKAIFKVVANTFLNIGDVVFPGFKDKVLGFVDSIKGFFEGLFKGIKSGFESLGTAVGLFGDKIKDTLSKVPLIGSLFKEGASPGAIPGAGALGLPGGGAGALATLGPSLGPSSPFSGGGSTNNSNQSIQVNNDIKVTQLPGEDGQDFALRFKKNLGEEVATSVRNNNSGRVY